MAEPVSRIATIIGRATDWSGIPWDVRERRPTEYGFDILLGWPTDEPRGRGCRGVGVIPTPELVGYLAKTRLRDIDLPINRSTIKRLRRMLDVRWSWDDWWVSRTDDLRSMTLEAFCDKHGCSMGAASQRRTALKP